ncbi:hypothetical protein PFISCL1PPCAC_14479, partial [Pristionchus fissidentatus]
QVARQLFHISGTPFEDIRVPKEEWATLKAITAIPFGKVPLLEVDGEPLPQSFAINRYLANEYGFAGNSPFESAWIDALADAYKDYFDEIHDGIGVIFGIVPGGDKEKTRKEIFEPARDKFFPALEQRLNDAGSSGFLVGSSLTWVDLLVAEHFDVMSPLLPGYFDVYPAIVAHHNKVHAVPKVKEWVAIRPKTPF